jgi:hypothetical protein
MSKGLFLKKELMETEIKSIRIQVTSIHDALELWRSLMEIQTHSDSPIDFQIDVDPANGG